MRTLLLAFSLALGLSCPAQVKPTLRPAQDHPNIIFIFVDDPGYADFSCMGNTKVKTPHVDRLAAEGTLFKQFYVASPICSPSRVGCTTGQFPARHLINSYLNNRKRNKERGMRDYLDPKAPCIARAFQSAGYATAHYGKWHMGGGRDVGDAPLPKAYGFDDSFVCFEGLGPRVLFGKAGLKSASAKLGRGPIELAPKHELTPMYVDKSIAFLEKNKDKPVYIHLWLNDVHDAHVPAPGEQEKFAGVTKNELEQKMFAVLVAMDREIGRLVAAVDKAGMKERTMIVLTGDNGPTAWKRQYYDKGIDPPGDTGGYRGRKWSLYEGGTRQPLIVRWPGKVPAGRVDEETILAAVDFFPTFTSMAGVKAPDVAFDGIDAKEAYLGKPLERKKPIFWEYGRDDSYLRPGLKRDQSPNLALRDGKWKCLINADGTDLQLYDFSKSQKEEKNVAPEHPEVAERMAKQLLEWRKSLPVLKEE